MVVMILFGADYLVYSMVSLLVHLVSKLENAETYSLADLTSTTGNTFKAGWNLLQSILVFETQS